MYNQLEQKIKKSTVDQTNSITILEKRKRGKHLIQEERGMIPVLHSQGLTLCAIAEYVGCAHTTVYYELRAAARYTRQEER